MRKAISISIILLFCCACSGQDGGAPDSAHMAIACTRDGKMHFIHASSRAGKVIIEPKTLAEYAVNGIRVARLKF